MVGRGSRLWLRLVGFLVAVLTVSVVSVVAEPALPALCAPARPASVPVDGLWRSGPGPKAGCRIRETVFGLGNDVVGRTSAVEGAIRVSRGEVTSREFAVDLRSLRIDGKAPPPIAAGRAVTTQAVVVLSLNGVARRVSFPIEW